MSNSRLNYRSILKTALLERCQNNPRYSLRAFARDLDMDPSQLSEVLNERKGISKASATSIARCLGMNGEETSLFCDLVESAHARSKVARAAASARVGTAVARARFSEQSLGLEAFQIVSDWHHLAVLQVLKLPGCRGTPGWVARALGIQLLQVEESLARLERLELVKRTNGAYSPSAEQVFSPDGVPSEAIRKFHGQVLRHAISALHSHPVPERDFVTTLMPVSSADMDKARKKIRAFHQELCAELSRAPAADRVYALSVQFFNLTPTLKEIEHEHETSL